MSKSKKKPIIKRQTETEKRKIRAAKIKKQIDTTFELLSEYLSHGTCDQRMIGIFRRALVLNMFLISEDIPTKDV